MMTLKLLMVETNNFAFAAGASVTIPTADDLRLFLSPEWEFARVVNETVHVMPYVGFVGMANERLFVQGILQIDIDANGNPVLLNADNTSLRNVGHLQDATWLYADIGVGYWLYQNNQPNTLVTGFAPTVELHYNRTLKPTDAFVGDEVRIGQFRDALQNLNLVVGGTAKLGSKTAVQVGYTAPIGNSVDHQFDGELRVLLNRFF